MATKVKLAFWEKPYLDDYKGVDVLLKMQEEFKFWGPDYHNFKLEEDSKGNFTLYGYLKSQSKKPVKYQVIDTGKTADNKGFVGLNEECWGNSKFKNFSEALEYAKNWLGMQKGCLPNDWVGERVDYNGYGDYIEIIEVI